MTLHEFDPATLFCMHCGLSVERALRLECVEADNVVGISHLLAQKKGTWVIETLETINGMKS